MQVAAIVVQHVADGARVASNIAAISQTARELQALLVVDASNSVGLLDVDCTAMHVDALVARGNGYLRGPRNTTLAFVKESMQTTSIRQALICDVHVHGNITEFAPVVDGCGTHAFLVGLGAACEHAHQVGLTNAAKRITWLVEEFLSGIEDIPFVSVANNPATIENPHARLGYTTVTHDRRELTPKLFELLAQDDITVGLTEDSNGDDVQCLVLAFQYYNTKDEINTALMALRKHAAYLEREAEAAEDSEWVTLDKIDVTLHGTTDSGCRAPPGETDSKAKTTNVVTAAISKASVPFPAGNPFSSVPLQDTNPCNRTVSTQQHMPQDDCEASDASFITNVENNNGRRMQSASVSRCATTEVDADVAANACSIAASQTSTDGGGVSLVCESSGVSADDEADGSDSDVCVDFEADFVSQLSASPSTNRKNATAPVGVSRSAPWESLTTSLSCDMAATASEDDEPWVQMDAHDLGATRVSTFTNPLFGMQHAHSDTDEIDTDFDDQFDDDELCKYYGSSTVTDDEIDDTDDEVDGVACRKAHWSIVASQSAPVRTPDNTDCGQTRPQEPAANPRCTYTPPRTQPMTIPAPKYGLTYVDVATSC